LVLSKSVAYGLMLIGVIAFSFVGLVVGVAMTPALVVDMGRLTLGTLNMIPGSLVMLAFTVLAGTLFRRRGTAAGAAALFIFGSYFLDTLGRSAPGSFVDSLRAISFYSYYDGTNVIQNGLSIPNIALLSVLAVGLIGVGMAAYQRRDIGV